jgi:hypothetical protein
MLVRSIGQPNPLSDTGGRARGACRTRSGQGHGSRAKPAKSPGAALPPIGLATTSAATMATIDFLSVRMANTVLRYHNRSLPIYPVFRGRFK